MNIDENLKKTILSAISANPDLGAKVSEIQKSLSPEDKRKLQNEFQNIDKEKLNKILNNDSLKNIKKFNADDIIKLFKQKNN